MNEDREALIREMSDVATIAVKIRKFLNHIASSFSFYVYSLGVIGPFLVAKGLGEMLGGNPDYWNTGGIILGVLIATYLHGTLLSKIVRSLGVERGASRSKYALVLFMLIFLGIGVASYLVGELVPSASSVSWYPPLAVLLLVIYLMMKSEYTFPHLVASIIMLATSPLVLYTGSIDIAIGLLLISYLIAGTHSAYKALEELGG